MIGTSHWCPRCRTGHQDRCPVSAAERHQDLDRRRGSARKRGYDGAWEAVRAEILEEEPECRRCKAANRLKVAVMVDHIVPLEDGGARLDKDNLQPLCRDCHAVKTAEDLQRRRMGIRGGKS